MRKYVQVGFEDKNKDEWFLNVEFDFTPAVPPVLWGEDPHPGEQESAEIVKIVSLEGPHLGAVIFVDGDEERLTEIVLEDFLNTCEVGE